MSSHHIIRENQEPAVFLAGPNVSEEKLGQLLEWSPFFMADESMKAFVESRGLGVDAWIEEQSIENALDAMKSRQGAYLYVVGLLPGIEFLNEHCQYILPSFRVYAIRSGWSKWYPVGQKIEFLLPIGSPSGMVEMDRDGILEWKGEGINWVKEWDE